MALSASAEDSPSADGDASGEASASVAGTVTDAEAGDPLAGAVVFLGDLDRRTVTDARGRYVLRDVPPGPQRIVVRRIGYSRRSFHALVPRRGTLEINVALRAEPIRFQAIDVRAPVPVRGLERADSTGYPDRSFSLSAVRNDPLLPEPDVLAAADGGEVILHPETPSGIHVRGGGPDQVAYVLDGVPIMSPYHAAGVFSSWNPDALSRIEVLTASARPDFPDALAGVLSARTRPPGDRVRTRGSMSTTQVRATIDGPMSGAGAGYLLSLRFPFTGLLAHKHERSHLGGEGADALAKVVWPALGGRLEALWYEGESDVAASASAEPEVADFPGSPRPRNAFGWASRSIGARWTRQVGDAEIHVRAWDAAGSAEATWSGSDSLTEHLAWTRGNDGLVATAALRRAATTTEAGLRVERSRTYYRLESDSASFLCTARTPVSALFARHRRSVTSRGEVDLSLTSVLAAGGVHLDPAAQIRITPAHTLSVTGTYTRRSQFEQSLRNSESVVGNIFPADLLVGAGASGVPVGRSDLGVVALTHRPASGVRLGAQAWARRSRGLALVAPRSAAPFATGEAVDGSSDARGAALEVAAGGPRFGLVASYGLQSVSISYADTAYVPDDAPTHTIRTGVVFFPSVTSEVRVGVTSALGRRTSAVFGPLEWEACNLLDMGCELAGSPGNRADPLGTTRLPAYLRVDLAARKHWHVRLGPLDGQVAAFGTVTNLLARRNVLTVVVDPATGARRTVEMRPLSPLLVGVDWRF